MGVKLTSAKRLALQCKFREYDASGDGKLNHEELKRVLTAGNPDVTDAEVARLFRMVDRNRDGSIDFDEFVDFIFDQEIPFEPTPPEIAARFTELFGEEGMDTAGWQQICSDCRLFDVRFRQVDAAPLFAKARPRGKKRIALAHLDKLLGYAADKKGMLPSQLHEQMLRSRKFMHGGNRGTSPEPALNRSPPGTANGSRGRSSSKGPAERRSRSSSKEQATEEEDDWGAVEATFATFCRQAGSMDRSEIVKLCDDCGLLEKDLRKADVEIMFSGVMTQQKRIDFSMFRDLMRTVARRKSIPVREVQWKIACCNGPRRNVATPLAPTAESRATAGLSGEGADARRERIKAGNDCELGEEMGWKWVKGTFDAFAEGAGGLDGSRFQKLCDTCGLLAKGFGKTEADVVFSKYINKQRQVTFEKFKDVLRDIARKRQMPIVEVQKLVGYNSGPPELESQAEEVRLHDDVTSYTGAAMAKHMELRAGS